MALVRSVSGPPDVTGRKVSQWRARTRRGDLPCRTEASVTLPRVICVLAVAAAAESGCTLIGLAAGRTIDERRPPIRRTVPRGELDVLDSDERIEMLLRDGSIFTGRFLGLDTTRPSSYAARYARAREALSGEQPLPALDATVRLRLVGGKEVTGALHGFGPSFVSLITGSRRTPRTFGLDEVGSLLDAAGHEVSGGRLRALLDEGQLPTTTALRVARAGAGSDTISYDDIVGLDLLEVPSHAGRTTGLVLGIAGDATVVWGTYMLLLVHALEQIDFGSCPLFESYDGREWRLDAEPLGGTIAPALERTDLARIEHVAEVDGEYRLRVRNDQPELDYLDALALRVVDHAPGTEVVPGADGRVHVIGSALAPLAPLRASADGQLWSGRSPGLAPESPRPLRDGVVVEFPRPAGADSAVLVLRVGGTSLGPLVLRETLALHGRELSAFYAGLESEPGVRAVFEEALERELLPAVSVWDGADWRRVGTVRDLPSLVLRDIALPLDLRGIPGGTLRLRIEGAPGTWTLDRAALALVAEPAASEETRLDVASAVTGDGRDVSGILRRPDGRRFLLRPGLDKATLRFVAPPRRPGFARSLLLEATGHCSLVVPADGTSRAEEFRRLVQVPGALARYALERSQRPH